MRTRFFRLSVFIAIVSLASAIMARSGISKVNTVNPGDAVNGIWLTEDGKAKLQIYRSSNNKYYGKIVWLKTPYYDDGKPKVDKNNPDEKLRTRPLMGLLLLRDFNYEGDNLYENGNIYDPESGNDYSCKMTLEDPNTLDVRGFIGFSLFGRTETWKRVKL